MKNRKSISPGQITQILGFVRDIIKELAPGFAQVQSVINDKGEPNKVAELKEAIKQVLIKFFVQPVEVLAVSLDPKDIHEAWVQLYAKWDIPYIVPEIPTGIADRIVSENERGRVLIYLAPELATVPALAELGKLFPKMGSWAVSGNSDAQKIKNAKDLSGWLFVEQALNIPNSNTTEVELQAIFSNQNSEGMTLNTYIIFGQFCREILGQYPDAPGWVRLLSSSYDDSVLTAYFNEDGDLDVYLGWHSDFHSSDMGGRSAAV